MSVNMLKNMFQIFLIEELIKQKVLFVFNSISRYIQGHHLHIFFYVAL